MKQQDGTEGSIRKKNIQRILAAGIEVFSRKGLDGARIVEIANVAGLPKGNVYYYFSSKEEIYDAALAHLVHSWDEAFAYISADRDPADAIAAYVRAKIQDARENAAETRLFANEILQGAEHLPREVRTHMRTITAEKAQVIDAWVAAGKIVPVNARHLFILLWSATQFYAEFEALACDALHVTRLETADYDLAAETITQTVLRGISPGFHTERSPPALDPDRPADR